MVCFGCLNKERKIKELEREVFNLKDKVADLTLDNIALVDHLKHIKESKQ